MKLQYGANTPSRDFQILLTTNRSVRPIVIGNFPHRFFKAESQRSLQLMTEEVAEICNFVNLHIKPSYLVDGKGDYSAIFLNYQSKQKILEHTPDILTFTSIFRRAGRETWSFDLNLELVYTYGFNDYQQGIAEFDRAVAFGSSSAYLYHNRGYAKQRLNLSAAALADYQQALNLARKDGNKELEKSLLNSIDDIQTETQRMAIGIGIALLLTGICCSGLVLLARRNEQKYLRNLTNKNVNFINLI